MDDPQLLLVEDFRAALQFLVNWCDDMGYLDDHCFTWPDGTFMYATDTSRGVLREKG